MDFTKRAIDSLPKPKAFGGKAKVYSDDDLHRALAILNAPEAISNGTKYQTAVKARNAAGTLKKALMAHKDAPEAISVRIESLNDQEHIFWLVKSSKPVAKKKAATKE